MNFDERLKHILVQHKEIEKELSSPDAMNDQQRFMELSIKHSSLNDVVKCVNDYFKSQEAYLEAKDILKNEKDAELIELAKEEIKENEKLLDQYEKRIKVLLLPTDPRDKANIIIEIRAGTGGDEAALFAADLFKMYSLYAERFGWKVELISSNSTDLKGFKEVVFAISGQKVYSKMKYESGVHRVQRVPETESGGRVHTSAVTVAIMPEPEEVEVQVNNEDLRIDTYRASGAGGQHVNKTESAIRITHIPSGLVVSCQDEKSQIKNKAKALKVLKARLYDQTIRQQQAEIAKERKSQVGSGDRSERIRTYNFPQNRVSDHRINLTIYKLDQILLGTMDEIIDNLNVYYQTQMIEAEFESI